MKRRARACAVASLVALAGCGARGAKPLPIEPPRGGAVAQVGDVSIPASLVGAVAGAEGVSPRAALESLVDDALAARGARDQGLEREASVWWAQEAALARLVPARLTAEARALGSATDDELDSLTVVHAVVLREPGLSREHAIVAATNIARAVEGARTAADFLARAKAVPWQHAHVVAESIGPFAIDGRTPRGALDEEFVAACFALREPLQRSPIVTTSFGWHVIMLVSRTPSPDRSAERRGELAGAAVEIRVRTRVDEVLRARRERAAVDVARDADANMGAAVEALPP